MHEQALYISCCMPTSDGRMFSVHKPGCSTSRALAELTCKCLQRSRSICLLKEYLSGTSAQHFTTLQPHALPRETFSVSCAIVSALLDVTSAGSHADAKAKLAGAAEAT